MQDPLVFLPCIMATASLFAPQLEFFGQDRPVTVAPLAPGERVEEIASNLLDHLPRRFALAGMGLGGVVAMEMLRRAPDRLSRIALINTHSLAETPQTAAALEPLIIKLRAGQVDSAVSSFLPLDDLAAGPHRAAVMAEFTQMARGFDPAAIVKQLRAHQRRRDYQPVLRRCKVPALVMCGQQDGGTPVKRHGFMADLIPYAELAVIEEAGRLPTWEAPDATNAALAAWLAQPYVLQKRADA